MNSSVKKKKEPMRVLLRVPGQVRAGPKSLSQILRTEYSLDEIVQSIGLEDHLTQ